LQDVANELVLICFGLYVPFKGLAAIHVSIMHAWLLHGAVTAETAVYSSIVSCLLCFFIILIEN
jgi:hypothetical protein